MWLGRSLATKMKRKQIFKTIFVVCLGSIRYLSRNMKNSDDINLLNMTVPRNWHTTPKMTDSHMFCTGIVSVMIIRCIGIHIPAALLGVGKVFMLADSECTVYGKEGILWYNWREKWNSGNYIWSNKYLQTVHKTAAGLDLGPSLVNHTEW